MNGRKIATKLAPLLATAVLTMPGCNNANIKPDEQGRANTHPDITTLMTEIESYCRRIPQEEYSRPGHIQGVSSPKVSSIKGFPNTDLQINCWNTLSGKQGAKLEERYRGPSGTSFSTFFNFNDRTAHRIPDMDRCGVPTSPEDMYQVQSGLGTPLWLINDKGDVELPKGNLYRYDKKTGCANVSPEKVGEYHTTINDVRDYIMNALIPTIPKLK